MLWLGFKIILGTYVVLKVNEHNTKVKQKKKRILRKKTKRLKNPPVSSPNTSQDVNHYLKVSATSLILSFLSLPFPALKLLNLGLIGYSGMPIFKLAVDSMKRKKLTNDVLSALIISGSIVTGRMFVAGLASGLYHLGNKVIAQIRSRSEYKLTEMFYQPSDKVWVLKDCLEMEVSMEDLKAGDVVIVKAGEGIPVDGIIVDGAALVDQQSLTGEFVPAEKKVGDTVFASTLILRGNISIQVRQAGSETLASRLSDILNDTAHYKTNTQTKGEEWADRMAAFLLGSGLILSPFVGVARSLALLNSSPGNMVRIFTSLQTLNHVTIASRNGILIKDGRVLEELANVDTVIFDKTGTLTQKQPTVGEVVGYNGYAVSEVLRYAAIAEQKIEHPFAKAIVEKAKEYNLFIESPDDSEYRIGYGIFARYGDHEIRIGSSRFIEGEGIEISGELDRVLAGVKSDAGQSLVMIAIDNQVMGTIEIIPQIRPGVQETLSGLRTHGVKYISIVSGDHERPTRQLSDHLNMDSYYYHILPEQKAQIVEELQKQGRTVCFVGDGVNDAIAMKKANVSVSLSGATSAATDVAQVLLMEHGISHLCDLFDVSRQLNKRLQESISISLGNGLVCAGSALCFGVGILGSLLFVDTVCMGVGISHAMLPLRKMTPQK